MIEIKGRYSSARIYADIVDEETITQIYELLNQEFCSSSKIRIMPDCHTGKGCVIGTTMTIVDKVVPGLVGVDIGCGMRVVKLGKININFKEIDDYINEFEPKGVNINSKELEKTVPLQKLRCLKHLSQIDYVKKSIGTIGGGNHFIEIDKDDEDNYYLIIHTGSRNLGGQVALYYQKVAVEYQKNKVFNKEEEKKKVLAQYKNSGKIYELERKLKEIKVKNVPLPMPKELCYLENELLQDYLFDMDICQKYASKNREVVAKTICEKLGLKFSTLETFETIHNYINMEDKILRKGAISAYSDETVLIPINMKEGCILGKGKSCSEYNYSAPHGAGRLMSRRDAKDIISLQEYKDSMKGIYSTSISEATIDESPFAYKPIESILENIKDTVEIIKIIKPVYNYKRGK